MTPGGLPKRSGAFLVVMSLLAAFAIVLCWRGVSWAFQMPSMLILDEVGNLTRFLGTTWWNAVQPIPVVVYNQRPAGFALERLLFDLFGFDYTRQLICFLALHFANCIMAFALFRRLGLHVLLCLAAVGVYGSLNTTVQTATYIGAIFDVLCLFFILGSMLTLLWHRRGATILSAFLFFMSLLSKEFAVVVPIPLALLVLSDLPESSWRKSFRAIVRRLWMHFIIGSAFVLRYLYLTPAMIRTIDPHDPYRMDLRLSTVLRSFANYTAFMFNAENIRRAKQYILAGLILLGILIGGIVLRRLAVLFGLVSYVLMLLPVTLIPGIHSPFYLYAPQLFLIFAAFLVMDGILRALYRSDGQRWIASAVIATVCLAVATPFERGRHFLDDANFSRMLRSTAAQSAKDVFAQFGAVPAGAHVYVNHGDVTPWLFQAGPCDFLKVVNRQTTITCVMDGSPAVLQNLYTQDKGPKFYVDYHPDGSLTGFLQSR
jgi:hypothetical protein